MRISDWSSDVCSSDLETLLDTLAACGDDSRGVMCTVDPESPPLHAEVSALAKRVSDHVIPKTRGYHEIWHGEQRVASSAPEEPFYGPTYMAQQFTNGFAFDRQSPRLNYSHLCAHRLTA